MKVRKRERGGKEGRDGGKEERKRRNMHSKAQQCSIAL
jgi:hypothetical protein